MRVFWRLGGGALWFPYELFEAVIVSRLKGYEMYFQSNVP